MPPVPPDKKNSLQSAVDYMQNPGTPSPFEREPAKTYVPNPELKSLRTFQGDMQEHIEVKKESITSIALAEQKKKIVNNEPTYTEPRAPKKYGLFTAITIVALIAGGAIFGGLFFIQSEQEEVVDVAMEETLISYTNKKEIALQSLDSQSIASALLQEQSSYKAVANSVLYTKFTQGGTPITSSVLLEAIAPSASDALKRNITTVMSGIYSYDTSEIFFILKPDDFGIVYSEMLDWENTLGSDLSAFYPPLQQHLSENPPLFSDETYKNKDVRVLRNESGNIVLLYGFIDKDTLVITANERIFEAILNRYLQSKLSR